MATSHYDRLVLFGAVNVETGHRVLQRASSMRHAEMLAFLRELRSRYRAERGRGCCSTGTAATIRPEPESSRRR